MFVNKHEKGEDPSIEKLKNKLMAVNIVTCLIDTLTLIYYILIIYHLHKDYKSTDAAQY